MQYDHVRPGIPRTDYTLWKSVAKKRGFKIPWKLATKIFKIINAMTKEEFTAFISAAEEADKK